MIARFDWQIGRRSGRQSRVLSGHWSARRVGVWLGSLTAVFLSWMLFHYALVPHWFANWPPVLADTLRLLEAAGIVTVVLLWVVWGWQYVQEERPFAPPAPGPLPITALYALSPGEFEQYVASLFAQKGYKVKLRGRSGDHGVDLELSQPSGKRAIVQCKRYQRTIGPDIVRELYGTLIHERVAHAFLVTTADISESAREWAQGKPITLIDGELLVQVAAVLDP